MTSVTTQVLVFSAVAGLSIPIGALLSRVARFRSAWLASEVSHGVLAFGAGALLAAVALVLIPTGVEALSLPVLTLAFFAGGLCFAWLAWILANHESPLGLVVAMLTDFVPECLALGALFVTDNAGARLLAVLIAVQNLPEAFSSYREFTGSNRKRSVVALVAFAALAPIGPLAAYLGLAWLADEPTVIAFIMTFAGGGILYLMFQEIAPKVVLRNAWLPPMGALAGFFVGVLGEVLIG